MRSTKQGKRKHEIQEQQRGDGNSQASREGQSQGMSCVADLENNQPIEQEVKSPGDNPPDKNKKQKTKQRTISNGI